MLGIGGGKYHKFCGDEDELSRLQRVSEQYRVGVLCTEELPN